MTVRTRRDHAATAQRAKPTADWQLAALCKGRANMFDPPPELADKRIQRNAEAMCRACPVIRQCYAWVMGLDEAEDPGGVCGGLTEKERTQRRREDGKRCPRCRQIKGRSEYTPNEHKPGGLRTYCRPCEAARQREARAAGRQPEEALSG